MTSADHRHRLLDPTTARLPGRSWVEHIMGTAISVHLADPLPPARLHELASDTFAWFREVDQRFSTYLAESEVNQLDRREITLDSASADLRDVIDRCAGLWRETDGYFDCYATGRLDPSGYVKGWSVQVASDRLRAAGSEHHIINAGGDVRGRGGSQPGQAWRVGVRDPWRAMALSDVLVGTDLAVATSGTYERGAHVIDPRRGHPAQELRSVTLVARGPGADLGDADAYATAALAMGRAGLSWLSAQRRYEFVAVTDDGQWLRSPGLPTATDDAGAAPAVAAGPDATPPGHLRN